MDETKFVNKLKKYYNNHDKIWIIKIHGGMYQTTGLPDLIACSDGDYMAVECKCIKSPKRDSTIIPLKSKLVTPIQQHTIKQIHNAQGNAMVAVLLWPDDLIYWSSEVEDISYGEIKIKAMQRGGTYLKNFPIPLRLKGLLK